MTHSVAVIGAGPTGLMLACELRLAGVDVVVLDAAEDRNTGANLRATMLHARAAELLDRRGLMEPLRDPEPTVWPLIHFGNFWLDLTHLIEHEHSLIIPQVRTAGVIEARARELGAEIRRGHRLTGLSQDDSGVTAEVAAPDGSYELTAGYLVGCDGEHSRVRNLAGFRTSEEGTGWHGLLADFEHLEGEWATPMYPGGLFAVGPHPFKPDWLRVMTVEFGDVPAGGTDKVTAKDLNAASLRITGRESDLPEPSWAYRYQGRTQHVTSYRQGRVFLAGDSAHVHYFGAGHGVNTGLHDAVNLGWKLAAEINGWAPAGLLDTYHEERHAVGHRAVMSTEAQLQLQHPADRVGPLRELFGELVKFEDVNRHLVQVITEVRYPIGDPADAERHALLGRSVPHVTLKTAEGEVSLAAALRTGRGLLVDLSGGALDTTAAAVWTERVDVLAAQPVSGIDAAAVLIRPDGFVAWAAQGDDDKGLREALTTWFGEPGR